MPEQAPVVEDAVAMEVGNNADMVVDDVDAGAIAVDMDVQVGGSGIPMQPDITEASEVHQSEVTVVDNSAPVQVLPEQAIVSASI